MSLQTPDSAKKRGRYGLLSLGGCVQPVSQLPFQLWTLTPPAQLDHLLEGPKDYN